MIANANETKKSNFLKLFKEVEAIGIPSAIIKDMSSLQGHEVGELRKGKMPNSVYGKIDNSIKAFEVIIKTYPSAVTMCKDAKATDMSNSAIAKLYKITDFTVKAFLKVEPGVTRRMNDAEKYYYMYKMYKTKIVPRLEKDRDVSNGNTYADDLATKEVRPTDLDSKQEQPRNPKAINKRIKEAEEKLNISEAEKANLVTQLREANDTLFKKGEEHGELMKKHKQLETSYELLGNVNGALEAQYAKVVEELTQLKLLIADKAIAEMKSNR